MNKIIFSVLAVVAILASGCASKEYIIGTKTGNLVRAHGKPELDEKTGTYKFKDAEGRSQSVAKDQVVEIMER